MILHNNFFIHHFHNYFSLLHYFTFVGYGGGGYDDHRGGYGGYDGRY